MGYVAMIGLIFVPLLLLLCTGLFYVRWQNEHENEQQAEKDKKRFRGFAIAAVVSAAVFLLLRIIFPIPA